MTIVDQTDKVLEPLFKDVPNLPEVWRENLTKAWPWIALVFGIIQLAAAWALWGLTSVVNNATNTLNSLGVYGYPGTVGLSSSEKLAIYIALAILAADAVILLLAFSPLKSRLRRGWDLLFLGSLLNLAYSVVSVFISGRGISSLIGGLIGSAISFYFLYQVKGKFNGSMPAAAAPAPSPSASTEE